MRAEDAEDYERPVRKKATQTAAQQAAVRPAATQAGNTSGTVAPFSYQTPRFNASQYSKPYKVSQAPQFYVAPYMLPDPQATFDDPSYQFRLNEGLKALERSAAARGTLRTGNTLEDLMRYGQDYASQEYQNAVNRGLQQYQTNLGVSEAMYAPSYATWQAQNEANAAASQQAADLAWRSYYFPIEDERMREEMLLRYGAG